MVYVCSTGYGGTFSGIDGQITSPGYPNVYDNNLDLEYIITVTEGSTIKLDFENVDIEYVSGCSYDSVQVCLFIAIGGFNPHKINLCHTLI